MRASVGPEQVAEVAVRVQPQDSRRGISGKMSRTAFSAVSAMSRHADSLRAG